MQKTNTPDLKADSLSKGLASQKKRRRFRDPRLRWMDEVLLSLRQPAPEAWLPAQYRYLCRQTKKVSRPIH